MATAKDALGFRDTQRLLHGSIDSKVVDEPVTARTRDEFRLLSVQDVADILRTTPKAVYAMFARGQLPAPHRIGRRLLIAEQDLLRWLKERRELSPEHRR